MSTIGHHVNSKQLRKILEYVFLRNNTLQAKGQRATPVLIWGTHGLKTIGKLSKVQKLLHFHLARHTFATTIALSNGVPIESVSSMLGHATIRQTQDYAKVVALKLTNDMKRVDLVYS